MRHARKFALLFAAGICAAAAPWPAPAQQKPPAEKPAAGKSAQPPGTYYDQYEPSRRQRLRRESCTRNEDESGAFCVKRCDTGYRLVPGANPPRCRSIKPLPPGQKPGPVRKQVSEPYKPLEPPPPGKQPPPVYDK